MLARMRACMAVALAATAGCSRPSPEASSHPQAPAPIARLKAFKGGVEVKASGTLNWVKGQPDMGLGPGDLVRTLSGAGAEIAFPDGFVLKVSPDALLVVGATPGLRIGELAFSAQRKTPERLPSLAGPAFRWSDSADAPEAPAGSMSVERSGGGQVEQHRGRGEVVTGGGQRLDLGVNERVSVDAEGRAGEKVHVLPAPDIVAPAHQAALRYEEPARATTVLTWTPVPGATRYHVVVDDDAWFTQPLYEVADARNTALELSGLGPGKYYWRVASVDDRGIRGPFSDFSSFTVAKAAPGPALLIESIAVQRNVLRVQGRTDPGASVTVNGQRLEVLADGSFLEYVTLASLGPQKVVIRAEADRGRATTVERMVSATSF